MASVYHGHIIHVFYTFLHKMWLFIVLPTVRNFTITTIAIISKITAILVVTKPITIIVIIIKTIYMLPVAKANRLANPYRKKRKKFFYSSSQLH